MEKIFKKTTSEMVYESIKSSIVKGKLSPNQPVFEIELAESLGVSRTPVREALKVLSQEGWVKQKSSNRLIVSPLSKKEVEDLFLIRSYLEALSVRQAMTNKISSLVTSLEEIITKMKKEPEEVLNYGKEFHEIILEQTGNMYLIKILSENKERIELYRRLSVSKVRERSDYAIKEHIKIFEAIRSNNKIEAEQSMRDHINKSYENIVFSEKIFNKYSQ